MGLTAPFAVIVLGTYKFSSAPATCWGLPIGSGGRGRSGTYSLMHVMARLLANLAYLEGGRNKHNTYNDLAFHVGDPS